RPGSAVGRDLLGAGYQALLAGDLARNLRGAFQGLELRGTVGGDAEVEVGARQGGGSPYMGGAPPGVGLPAVPAGLALADSAQVKGRLDYTAPEDLSGGGKVAGGVVRHEPARTERPARAEPGFGDAVLNQLRRFAALLVVGLLLLWLAPAWTRRVADI